MEQTQTVLPEPIEPHSIDSEEALLGSLLMDPHQYEAIAEIVAPADFYLLKHQWIFECMGLLRKERAAVDNISLAEMLRGRALLDKVGGPAFITYLINCVSFSIHADTYAQLVARASLRRKYLEAAGRVAQAATAEDTDISGVIERAEMAVLDVAERRRQTEIVNMDTAVLEMAGVYQDWVDNPSDVRGLRTGIEPLDHIIGGFQAGLASLVAPVHWGKSTVAVQVALSLMKQTPLLYIGTELSYRMVVMRMVCQLSGADYRDMRSGRGGLNPDVIEAFKELQKYPVYIVNVARPSVSQVDYAIRRYLSRGIQAVIVDSGNNVLPPKSVSSAIYDTTRAVTNALQGYAIKYEQFILATWQARARDIATRDDASKRVTMFDGKGASDIEADSDWMFTVDDPVYWKMVKGEKNETGRTIDTTEKRRVTLRILKDRHFPTAGRAADMFYVPGRGLFAITEDR